MGPLKRTVSRLVRHSHLAEEEGLDDDAVGQERRCEEILLRFTAGDVPRLSQDHVVVNVVDELVD